MYDPITPFTGAPRMPYTYAPYCVPSYSMYAPPATAMPSMTYPLPYAPPPYLTGAEIPQIPKEQEKQMQGQKAALWQQLDQIKKRFEGLNKM